MATSKMTPRWVLEHREELIGKKAKFMWTGMMISGTITKIAESDFSVEIYYDMDEPHVWGSDTYTSDLVWGRKADNFGPLKYTEVA